MSNVMQIVKLINAGKPGEAWLKVFQGNPDTAEPQAAAVDAPSGSIRLSTVHLFAAVIRAFLTQEKVTIDKLIVFLTALNKKSQLTHYAGVLAGLLFQLQHHPQAERHIPRLVTAIAGSKSALLSTTHALWQKKTGATDTTTELVAHATTGDTDAVVKSIFVAILATQGPEDAAQLFWRVIAQALKSGSGLSLEVLNQLFLAIPEDRIEIEIVVQHFLIMMPNGISIFPELLTHYLQQRAAAAETSPLPAIYCHLILAHIVLHDSPEAGDETNLYYFARLFYSNQKHFTTHDIRVMVALLSSEFHVALSASNNAVYIKLFELFNTHAETVAAGEFDAAQALLMTLVRQFAKSADSIRQCVVVLTNPRHIVMRAQCIDMIFSDPKLSSENAERTLTSFFPQIMHLIRTMVESISTWPCVVPLSQAMNVGDTLTEALTAPNLGLTEVERGASPSANIWKHLIIFIKALLNNPELPSYVRENLNRCFPTRLFENYVSHLRLLPSLVFDNGYTDFHYDCIVIADKLCSQGLKLSWQHLEELVQEPLLCKLLTEHGILRSMSDNAHLPLGEQLFLLWNASIIIDEESPEYESWLEALHLACKRHLTPKAMGYANIVTINSKADQMKKAWAHNICETLFIVLRDGSGDIAQVCTIAQGAGFTLLDTYKAICRDYEAGKWRIEIELTEPDFEVVDKAPELPPRPPKLSEYNIHTDMARKRHSSTSSRTSLDPIPEGTAVKFEEEAVVMTTTAFGGG